LLKKAVGPIQTLSGGGRYDGLIELLSGENVPAVGCGIGIERLLLAMERNGAIDDKNRLEYYVVYVNDATKDIAFKTLTDIRDSGHSAMMDYKGVKMKKQMSNAESLKAQYAIIIGESEYNEGKLLVKNMDSGTQCDVNIEEFKNSLKKKE
jgi:histidyl-tRNA synthetase